MYKTGHKKTHWLHRTGLAAAAILWLLLTLGCGEDNNNGESGPVGSAEVSWSMECPQDEYLGIFAQVYDASHTFLTHGGPWECSRGSGNVSSIPVGQDRKIVLFAEVRSGALVHRGEKGGIDIEETLTTDVSIAMQPFTVDLEEPYYEGTGQDFLSVILSWNHVSGAADYAIEIADNPDFIKPVVKDSVPGPPYLPEPADLASGGSYYVRVGCIDVYDPEIQGAWSDPLPFHPAPLIDILSPVDGGTYDLYQDIFLVGSAIDAIDGRSLWDEPQWFLVGNGSNTPLCGYSGCEFSSSTPGTYTLRFTATSQAGFVGSESVTFRVDPTP